MKKVYKLVLSLIVIAIIYFLLFVKYKNGEINLINVYNEFMLISKIVFIYIFDVFKNILDLLLTEDIFKIVLISIILIKVIDKYDLIEMLRDIGKVQIGEISIERLKSMKEQQEATIENIENGTDTENKKDEAKKKLEIINILINNPYIVIIINKIINKRIKTLKISLTKIKQEKIDLSTLGKIVDYDLFPQSIKIKNIKEDIKSLIFAVFVELKNNGAIYIPEDK